MRIEQKESVTLTFGIGLLFWGIIGTVVYGGLLLILAYKMPPLLFFIPSSIIEVQSLWFVFFLLALIHMLPAGLLHSLFIARLKEKIFRREQSLSIHLNIGTGAGGIVLILIYVSGRMLDHKKSASAIGHIIWEHSEMLSFPLFTMTYLVVCGVTGAIFSIWCAKHFGANKPL